MIQMESWFQCHLLATPTLTRSMAVSSISSQHTMPMAAVLIGSAQQLMTIQARHADSTLSRSTQTVHTFTGTGSSRSTQQVMTDQGHRLKELLIRTISLLARISLEHLTGVQMVDHTSHQTREPAGHQSSLKTKQRGMILIALRPQLKAGSTQIASHARLTV
ncbi:MAG: hypothetical protein BWY95_02624 [Bacteroidetes bacterium ADurb.BinA104]|nr:MAG: hypothetical protein BWY95_02624 [Bacteroidetes bacterium ADurb.BinA104]